jgi:Protein of unknown function (DUF3108)
MAQVIDPARAGLMALALALALPGAAHGDELKPYEATYVGIWHGTTVGVSHLKLERTGDSWTYSSRSEPRGLGRLAANLFPPLQVSVVRISGTEVLPQSFKSSGGSASKDTDLNYDWQAHRVTGTYEGTRVDLPLTPQVQDDGSVQLSLMVALLGGHTPDRFSVIDKNSVREYHYQREGTETLKTPFGDVATVIYSSQRANSPRVNRYWCAPERGFIPLRVQQKRGNDVEWTMEIQSLTRQ